MIIKKLVFNNNELLLFNYQNDTFALKSKLLAKDILKEKKNLEKMQRLKVQAQKKMTFVEGKNRQETARLKHLNNLIEKDFVFEDMNWLKEYIELKKSLKEIKSNTSQYESTAFVDVNNTSTNLGSQSADRKLPSRNQISQNTLSKKTSNTPQSAPSALSFAKTNTEINEHELDYLDYFKKRKETKQKSLKSYLTKSTSSKSSSKTYTISNFEDVSSIKMNTNYLLKKRKADECVDSDEESKIKHENKLFNFKNLDNLIDKNTNLQSNSYSTHTEIDKKCNVFPCVLLKSYTSMIGHENDLKENQLKSCGLKSVIGHNDQMNRVTLSRLTRNTEETDTTKYSEEKLVELNKHEEEDDFDFTKTIVDDLVTNKSIRRPLRNINSAKDFIAKLKSLEAKVKYCQDQNKINFKKTDRNIRYGDPLPKNNIYRQLRIISQFDS